MTKMTKKTEPENDEKSDPDETLQLVYDATDDLEEHLKGEELLDMVAGLEEVIVETDSEDEEFDIKLLKHENNSVDKAVDDILEQARKKNEAYQLLLEKLAEYEKNHVEFIINKDDKDYEDWKARYEAVRAENARLRKEMEEQQKEFQETLFHKDKMLKDVRKDVKHLGRKLHTLDVKTAIPKLKATITILAQQVTEYKQRQRQMEKLLKIRLKEISYLKDKQARK